MKSDPQQRHIIMKSYTTGNKGKPKSFQQEKKVWVVWNETGIKMASTMSTDTSGEKLGDNAFKFLEENNF